MYVCMCAGMYVCKDVMCVCMVVLVYANFYIVGKTSDILYIDKEYGCIQQCTASVHSIQ